VPGIPGFQNLRMGMHWQPQTTMELIQWAVMMHITKTVVRKNQVCSMPLAAIF
jgi:hypothetical protein